MMIVIAIVIAIVLMAMMSLMFIVLSPAYYGIMNKVNSTAQGYLSGTSKTQFNLINTIFHYSWGIVAVICIMAFLIWLFMYAQRREVVYGQY